MKKYIILTLLCITLLFAATSCNSGENKETNQNENITIVTASLSDYKIKDETVVFNTDIILKNNTQEDKYIHIKGDFQKEYKHKLVETQMLSGYHTETGYEVFLVPQDCEILFGVSFSGEKGEADTKYDRNPPEIIIEEIEKDAVDLSKVATEFAENSDGVIVMP